MSEFAPLSQDHIDRRNARINIDDAAEFVIQELVSDMLVAFEAERERVGKHWITYPDAHKRPFLTMGDYSKERPARANDLQVADLHKGLRVVQYNDKVINKRSSAQNWVILSSPWGERLDQGAEILYIVARKVTSHETDTLPLDPAAEGSQQVPLSQWGIVPMSGSELYNTYTYIEPHSKKPSIDILTSL